MEDIEFVSEHVSPGLIAIGRVFGIREGIGGLWQAKVMAASI
jgi:hypothetical protein